MVLSRTLIILTALLVSLTTIHSSIVVHVTCMTKLQLLPHRWKVLVLLLTVFRLCHYSHGLNNDLPDGTGCPTGYTFNTVYNSTAFGADNGGGSVDSNGAYYYNNGKFLINTWRGLTTTYTVTVTNTCFKVISSLLMVARLQTSY